MKKIITILMFVSLVVISSCGGGNNPTSTSNSLIDSNTSTKSEYDLGGVQLRIVANNAITADPRKDQYTGFFKAEKVKKINDAEKYYNIKIVFENYPSNASWGDARNRYIRESVAANKKIGHIFEITNGYMPELIQNGALAKLDTYFNKYVGNEFYPEKLSYIHFKDGIYNFDDRYPINNGGLYYNYDLLTNLGLSSEEMPAYLWNKGQWNWQAYENLALRLNNLLDENNDEYVMGGRAYNWAAKFTSVNGGYFVNSNLDVGINQKPAQEAFEFLSRLYQYPGMWKDEAPLDNAIEPEFKAGKIAFHHGEGWFLGESSKWADRDPKFKIGYAPFPVGPSTASDLSNYRVSTAFGTATFVMVKGYESVQPGFEKRMLSEELIFKIWNEIQHFGSKQECIDEYYTDFILKYIDDSESRKANKSVLQYAYSDYYSSMGSAATGLVEGSYNVEIQQSIRGGSYRDKLISLEATIKAKLTELYSKVFE